MEALIHNPLSRFLIQAFLIIASSRIIGRITRKIEQPMVIAEVMAGILLGPSLFGWLFPQVSAVIFARESLPLLKLVSEIGLIVFMFLIGLELDPKLLRGRGRASVAISHTSIVVPFALGGVLALYLYPRLSDSSVPFTSFTLFMGAAMSITAFPVLARILTERRLLRSKVGAITITCAAVDDVTAWCVLAFVVSIARATELVSAIWTTVFALAYIAVMLLGVRPFLGRLAARGTNKEVLTQDLVAVTLLLLIVSSWTTEMIGIHPLFGAFLLGTIMPKDTGFAQSLAEKLEDFAVVFLLPLFFAYSGLRTQIGLLNSMDGWLMCALIILVACVGKFGGSALAARLTGLRWREASALGILMNTRGLMELIVLNLGLDLGIISPRLFAMMVIMALLTTFMTSPLLRWIYPPEELAKELVETPDRTPIPSVAEVFTVLMCVSFDRSGPGMVTLASALAGREPERRRLYALRLIPTTDRGSFYMSQTSEQQGAAALSPLLKRAQELDVEVRPLSFVSPRPSEDICNVADVKQADLVLLGWHKPLLGQAVLGGTVYEVMRHARADVGVLIDRGLTEVRRLLVPFHGTVHDRAALALARRLAQQVGANVTILHVVKPERAREDRPLGARATVDEVFEGHEEGALHRAKVELKVVAHDSPADAALEEAAQGYDLVVVGVGHEWGLEQRRFGIQPEHILQGGSTSILVVRRRGRAPVARAGGRARPLLNPGCATGSPGDAFERVMHFGATLRLLRIDSGLSLRALAQRIGVSSAYLSRVEHGYDAVPTPDRLSAIARELGLPAPLLLELGHQVEPFVSRYLEAVPAANAMFLEIARRNLNALELARIKAFIDAEFPLGAPSSGGAAPARLGELLSPERVILHLSCGDLEDVVDLAAARLAPGGGGPKRSVLAREILERERESPTALGAGVVVPHAQIEGVLPSAVLVTLAKPLRSATPDDTPLRLVVVLVGNERGRRSLERLAQVARLATDDVVGRLCSARDPGELLSRLAQIEAVCC